MAKYPWPSGIIITTGKTSLADIFVQKVIEQKEEIDWRRNSVFALFGFAYLGCFQYVLYNRVYWKIFPTASLKDTIKKVMVVGFFVVGRFHNHIYLIVKKFSES